MSSDSSDSRFSVGDWVRYIGPSYQSIVGAGRVIFADVEDPTVEPLYRVRFPTDRKRQWINLWMYTNEIAPTELDDNEILLWTLEYLES